jgi:hypothetical protein
MADARAVAAGESALAGAAVVARGKAAGAGGWRSPLQPRGGAVNGASVAKLRSSRCVQHGRPAVLIAATGRATSHRLLRSLWWRVVRRMLDAMSAEEALERIRVLVGAPARSSPSIVVEWVAGFVDHRAGVPCRPASKLSSSPAQASPPTPVSVGSAASAHASPEQQQPVDASSPAASLASSGISAGDSAIAELNAEWEAALTATVAAYERELSAALNSSIDQIDLLRSQLDAERQRRRAAEEALASSSTEVPSPTPSTGPESA